LSSTSSTLLQHNTTPAGVASIHTLFRTSTIATRDLVEETGSFGTTTSAFKGPFMTSYLSYLHIFAPVEPQTTAATTTTTTNAINIALYPNEASVGRQDRRVSEEGWRYFSD